MNKNLLMITAEFPYPPTKGTWVDVWGQILFFNREGWHVILACRESPGRDAVCSDLPIEMTTHFLPEKRSRWYLSEEFETVQDIQALINQHSPQVVLCQYPHWISLVSAVDLKGAELWFRPHNFELAQIFIKIPNTLSWQFWKPGNFIWLAKWIRLLIYDLPQVFILERQMHYRADRLFFISWGDMNIMSQVYGGKATKNWVLPFLERQTVPVKESQEKLNVYYIGVGYDPRSKMQLAGANKMLKQIIPAVEAVMPGVFCFHFIGRGSRTYLSNYASETILLHDFVEDLQTFLQQMDICCVPVEIGWGCKIKVIEAFVSGIPVIGAPQAFYGFPPSDGAYFDCETTEAYVEAFRTLRDLKTRKQVAAKAKELYSTQILEGQSLLREAMTNKLDKTKACQEIAKEELK